MPSEVIGRDEELASVEAFLAEVERGPAALVLSGEAGIGKTILWEAAVEAASERFDRVLSCRGVEAEAAFAFSGLSELLAEVYEETAASLLPPRRRALEVALLLVEPGEETVDAHAIGLALLDLLRRVAERGSVLVAVDDLQWLDVSTAAVLHIALRRLRDEPVGLLAASRTTLDAASPFELERTFPGDRLRQLSLGSLSLGSLHHLLKERLDIELTRPELARVLETSGGNPFFALELGRELVRTGTRPVVGQALRVPESLHDLLGGRLARLPAETGDVLLHVAALAWPTVDVVAAAHGNRERVLDALAAALGEGVVTLDETRVRFVHPLLASICYEQAPVWKRRAVHAALAETVVDREERARHLALAVDGPDTAVASELEAAGEQAATRGATAAAAELAELAAELTPDDPILTRQRRLRAANFHRLAGDTERAAAMLERLRAEVPPGLERADVLSALAATLSTDSPTMIELWDEALAEAESDDVRSARILAFRSWSRLFQPDVPGSLVDARAALERAERVGDPTLLAVAISRVSQAELWASEITPGLLERGADIEERLGLSLEHVESPRWWLTRLLMRQGELDRSRAMLDELQARAVARGDEASRLFAMWLLSMLEWMAGRWQLALDYSAAAIDLGAQTQHPHNPAWVGRVRALIEVDLGFADQARASVEEGLAYCQASSNELFIPAILGVLGRLELALGNLEAAADHLRDLPERLLAKGLNDPTTPVWADAIETLVLLGELEAARSYFEHYELHARRLGSPLAMEGALRVGSLLVAAEGDPASAFVILERLLAERSQVPWPLERGRTLLCLGVVRRQAQQKKAAREALEQSLAIFEELGARLWAEKARGELRRISGRQPASDGLTETELRVATLAAEGRSNKEIAAELYIGVSTVEMHLSRVYRKLGARRAELASRLATVDETAGV